MQLRYTLIKANFLNLYHNLPNQIRTKVHSNLYSTNRKAKVLARFYNTYSTSHSKISKLNPFFITGLTDGEGSFVCIIKKSEGHRLGWRVEVVFQIGLHKKDLELLKRIKAYFGDTGTIVSFSDMCAFRVSSPEQIFKKILLHLALPRPGGQISFNKPETR